MLQQQKNEVCIENTIILFEHFFKSDNWHQSNKKKILSLCLITVCVCECVCVCARGQMHKLMRNTGIPLVKLFSPSPSTSPPLMR